MKIVYQRSLRLKPCLTILFPSNFKKRRKTLKKKGRKLWKKGREFCKKEERNSENKENTEILKSRKEALAKRNETSILGRKHGHLRATAYTLVMLSFWFLGKTKMHYKRWILFLFIPQKLYSRQRQMSNSNEENRLGWIVIQQVKCK